MRSFVGKVSPLVFGQTPVDGPGIWHIAGLVQSHWFAADAVVDGGGHVTSGPDRDGLEALVASGLGAPVHIGVWAPDGGPAFEFTNSCLTADGWAARVNGIRVPVTTIDLRLHTTAVNWETPHGFTFNDGYNGFHLGPRIRDAFYPNDLRCDRQDPGSWQTITQDTAGSNLVPMVTAGVYDGSVFRIFRNGVENLPYVQQTPCVADFATTFNQFRVGAWGTLLNPFNGQLCELHVYLGALTDAQVLSVSNDIIARRGI